jgi:cullin 1
MWPKQIFKYLDRFYTPKKNEPTTRLVAYQKWREIIFSGTESGVSDAILNLIYRDREGEHIDRDQLKTVIRIFVDCGLKQVPTKHRSANSSAAPGPKEEISYDMYENDFEREFLQQTREYYQGKSALWTQEDTFPDYMRKAEKLYESEKQRRIDYLDETTEVKLLNAIDEELVGAHQTTLLNNPDSGYITLLARFDQSDGADLEDLSRVFSLISRLTDQTEQSGLQPVAIQTRDWVQKVGLDIIHECECKVKLKDGKMVYDSHGRPDIEAKLSELIPKLANRYKLYEMLVHNVFDKDPNFMKALQNGFQHVMNQEVVDKPEYTDPKGKLNKAKLTTAPILLADYVGALLAKTGSTDEEILPEIQICISLFTHLQEKDVYIACHAEHLAQRLLTKKGVNMDWESQTVQWIKVHTGARMISGLEVMIQDMQNQARMNSDWVNHSTGVVDLETGPIKVEMKVLTSGKWPNYDMAECKSLRPHPAIAQCFGDYERWYLERNPRTILEPFWRLSNCEMSLHFTVTKKLAILSVPQACLIMLFAEDPNRSFSVTQIKDLLGYSPDSIRHDIEKLFKNRDRKKQLLRLHQQDPKVHRLQDSDHITLNDKYRKCADAKLDLTEFRPKISAEAAGEIWKKVMQEREGCIDACIVRMMKRAERLGHQQLIGKVIRELQHNFSCPPEAVSTRIEALCHVMPGEAKVILTRVEGTDDLKYNA